MQNLIEKITGRKQSLDKTNTLNNIIFGSTTGLNQAVNAGVETVSLRLGLWPIQSDQQPEVAMGVGLVLAALLERWRSIQVYRLVAQIDGEPESYQWNTGLSQFGVDDWELDGLDENVAVWGKLTQEQDALTLEIDVESDLSEDEFPRHVTLKAENLVELIGKLPQATQEIAEYLEAGTVNPLQPAYTVENEDQAELEGLLKAVFDWERQFFLWMWGRGWTDVLQDQQTLIDAVPIDSVFGAWIACNTIGRVLSPIYSPLSDDLLPTVEDTAAEFEDYPETIIPLSNGLFRCGDGLRAYDLLERSVEQYPDSFVSWFTLAELYRQGNEVGSAIDAFQRAIKAKAVSAGLYLRYADLLTFLDANNVRFSLGVRRNSATGRAYIEDVILVDADTNPDQLILREATAAYKATLDLQPNNVDALSQLVLQLIDLNDKDVWSQFDRLVRLDAYGDAVRSAIDAFYGVDDVEPGIKILREAAARQAGRVDLNINLAAAYLTDEQFEAARSELAKARMLVANAAQRAEIERLTLAADDPDFEARFGEITDLVNAGNQLSPEDVEFLEDVLERAPLYGQAYTLLAGAYNAWDETEDALDVLLDGQKHLPEDMDIVLLLARVLWDSDESELAFEYLNKALRSDPNNVELLALTGRYLYEDGQEDASRDFLQRAEAINPQSPVLRETRIFIARQMNEE